MDDKQISLIGDNELSTAAQSQAALAEVQTGFLVAVKMPRNEEQARVTVLDACKRPRFAEKAMYNIPIGGRPIKGLTIRAAEEVIRAWGNIRIKVMTVFEDEVQRKISVMVTDLQTNAGYADEVTVSKTKEVKEKNLKTTDEPLGQRLNSKNETVFILKTTQEDLKKKQNSEVSKSIRNSVLRLIPSDIKEEIIEKVMETQKGVFSKDIKKERKRLVDGYNDIGISPVDLEGYLGQTITTLSEEQLTELRGLYTAIKDGQINWKQVLKNKAEAEEAEKKNIDLNKITEKEAPKAEKGKKKKSFVEKTEKIDEVLEGKEESEMVRTQKLIGSALLELSGGDEETAKQMLREVTTEKDARGTTINFPVDGVTELSENRTRKVWAKVKPTLDAERLRQEIN